MADDSKVTSSPPADSPASTLSIRLTGGPTLMRSTSSSQLKLVKKISVNLSPNASPAERQLAAQQLNDMLQKSLAEKARLVNDNKLLQHYLAEYFHEQKLGDELRDTLGVADGIAGQVTSAFEDQDEKFAKYLKQIDERRKELVDTQSYHQRTLNEMRERLREKEARAAELMDSLRAFKREIALGAEYARTGKTVPPAVLDEYEAATAKNLKEVEKVRLKNITLKMHFQLLERQLKEREEKAKGLHLIDFEQLKAENQTFNDKIEERNEELAKLRKKITDTVMVIAHYKEKLQHMQAEASELRQRRDALEAAVTTQRDSIARAKQERDRLRSKNHKLKTQNGLIGVGSDDLLRDFENRKTTIASLTDRIQQLKGEHERLCDELQSLGITLHGSTKKPRNTDLPGSSSGDSVLSRSAPLTTSTSMRNSPPATAKFTIA